MSTSSGSLPITETKRLYGMTFSDKCIEGDLQSCSLNTSRHNPPTPTQAQQISLPPHKTPCSIWVRRSARALQSSGACTHPPPGAPPRCPHPWRTGGEAAPVPARGSARAPAAAVELCRPLLQGGSTRGREPIPTAPTPPRAQVGFYSPITTPTSLKRPRA